MKGVKEVKDDRGGGEEKCEELEIVNDIAAI